MNRGDGFREWLAMLRSSRSVCMLIPMEACMGHPIAVRNGAEYLLPFFSTTSAGTTDRLPPPFAYIRVTYPEGDILTYNDLRRMPDWSSTDRSVTAVLRESSEGAARLAEYYELICGDEPAHCDMQDELLTDAMMHLSEDGLPAEWYRRLIGEAKKYG